MAWRDDHDSQKENSITRETEFDRVNREWEARCVLKEKSRKREIINAKTGKPAKLSIT